MKILITGGAGFIGSHIVDHFVELGHEVAIIDDYSTGVSANLSKSINSIKNYICSITDLKECDRVFTEFKPEVIYHLAALKSVVADTSQYDDFINVNVHGTKNLLDLSIQHGVKKFVFSSTCAVYGDLLESAKEDGRVSPISIYALTKYMGEQLMHLYADQHNLDILVFRFSNVFGPRQPWNDAAYSAVIPKFIRNIYEHGEVCVYGDGQQTRDFMYVKDLVRMVSRLAQSNLPDKTFNIATGQSISILKLVEQLEKTMHKEVTVFFDEARKGEVYKKKLDTTRLWKQFWFTGCPITSFETALRETIEPIVNYKKPKA